MQNLSGPFKDIIPIFINYKRNMGYKYNNINCYYELDNNLAKNGITNINNSHKIFNYSCVYETNNFLIKRRYKCLIELKKFINQIYNKDFYLGELHFRREKFSGIFLTNKEIKILFNTIDKESKKENRNGKIYPIIFRLIYSSGLRVSEALNLLSLDFQGKNGLITIKNSKNNKTRIIPLSNTMNIILNKYIKKYNIKDNEKIFDITYSQLIIFFDKIKTKIKLNNLRIHDLRWTFINKSYEKLLSQNINENIILYYLQIYVGHSNIESTEYYLKSSPSRYLKYISKTNIKIGGTSNE